MQKSDTDSYNYSTIDDSAASTESTLRYCLWKKGTQFTYDIPDGLIEGDCVEVKGRLTGKRVVMELSGGPRNTADTDRLVPLRFRFSRGGHYKVHSDHLGRDNYRRGKFKWDFQADSAFTLQIRILQLIYDIRLNDLELIKFEHGQLHSEIQMLCLDGEAEFSAVEFIDIEDIGQPSTIDALMIDTSSENETGQIFSSSMAEQVAGNIAASPQSPDAASIKSLAVEASKAKAESPPSKRRRDSSKESRGSSVSSKEPSTGGHKGRRQASANSDEGGRDANNPPSMMGVDRHDGDHREKSTSPKTEGRHHDGRYSHRPSSQAASKPDGKKKNTGRPDAVISGRLDVAAVEERQPTSKKHRERKEKNSLADDLPSNAQNHAAALSQPSSRKREPMDVDNDSRDGQTRRRTSRAAKTSSKTSSSSEVPEAASNHRPDDSSRQEQPRVHKQRSSNHQSKETDNVQVAHKQPEYSKRADRPQAQLTTERQQNKDTQEKSELLKQKRQQSPSRTSRTSSDAPEASARKSGRDDNGGQQRQRRQAKDRQSQEEEKQKRESERQNSRHNSSDHQKRTPVSSEGPDDAAQRHEEKTREKQKRERRRQPDDDQLDAKNPPRTQRPVEDSAGQPEAIEEDPGRKKRSSPNSSKPQSTKHPGAQQQQTGSSKRPGSDATPPLSPQESAAVRSPEISRRKGHGSEKRVASKFSEPEKSEEEPKNSSVSWLLAVWQ